MPTLLAYDPAFAYEIAVIIKDGIERMYKKGENIFYYITVMNEPYAMPAMPAGARRRNSQGHVPLPRRLESESRNSARSFSAAARFCAKRSRPRKFSKKNTTLPRTSGASPATNLSTTTVSKPSAGIFCIPAEKPRVPYVSQCLADAPGVLVAASDYLKALPNLVSKWMPRRLASLGTDGFGRSEGRASSRDFFEVDARFIVLCHAL